MHIFYTLITDFQIGNPGSTRPLTRFPETEPLLRAKMRLRRPAERSFCVPLYEYECTKCGHRFERIEKVAGPHLKKCPDCAGKVERLASSPAIQFKGSGWYVTDYARKSAAGDSAKNEKAEASETKPAKETAPAKE